LLLQLCNSVGTLCEYKHINNLWAWLWVGQLLGYTHIWWDVIGYQDTEMF